MHAVLQSLADICKDGLGDGIASSNDHSTASAAQGTIWNDSADGAGERRESLAKEEDLLRSHPETGTQPEQRVAPRAVLQRQSKASQDRRAAPAGSKGPRGAAPLVRLKAAQRKPKLPARSAAPPQPATHAAGPDRSLAEALGHARAQEGLSQGMHERQRTAAGGPSAPGSTAPKLAGTTSWQTEQHEDTHISSCSMSASERGVISMPAEGMPERIFSAPVQPPSAAEAAEPRPLNIRGSEPLDVHGWDAQGSAVRHLGSVEEQADETPLRSRHKHRHPARQRHRKASQPFSPTLSTGKQVP